MPSEPLKPVGPVGPIEPVEPWFAVPEPNNSSKTRQFPVEPKIPIGLEDVKVLPGSEIS